jgi:hypothetical protein
MKKIILENVKTSTIVGYERNPRINDIAVS